MTLRELVPFTVALLLASAPAIAQKVPHDPDPIRLELIVEGAIRHGETLTVRVEPVTDVRLESVTFLAADIVTDDVPPFEIETVVSKYATGTVHFAAIGKREGGIVCCHSDSVFLPIESPLQFDRLDLHRDEILLDRVGDTARVPAVAHVAGAVPGPEYGSDGIHLNPDERSRENWLQTVPVEFESSDPEIVSVSEYGDIVALNPGTATIAIRLQSLEKSVTVSVRTRNKAPIPDAGPEARCVHAGTWLEVQGSAIDPDDGPDPLTYKWGWNGRKFDLDFEGASTPTLAGIVPDYEEFVLFLYVRDGEDREDDFIRILVDQDLDGKCKAGYKNILDVEPFVFPPERGKD